MYYKQLLKEYYAGIEEGSKGINCPDISTPFMFRDGWDYGYQCLGGKIRKESFERFWEKNKSSEKFDISLKF